MYGGLEFIMKNNSKSSKEKVFSNKKYYVLSFVATVVGFCLLFGFPASFVLGAIGAALGFGGFYCLLSVAMYKGKYSKPVIVKLDSGAEVKCTLLKMHTNYTSLMGAAFVFLKYLTPFYFIPAATKYFILYNVDRVTDETGKFDGELFREKYEYLNATRITKKRYKELMQNPQLCKDELAQKLAGQRAVFFEAVDKFEKNNLIFKEECTDAYAVYKLSDELAKCFYNTPQANNDLRIKFNYTGNNESQNGYMAFESLLKEGISYEKQFPLELILSDFSAKSAIQFVELNNDLFSKSTINKVVDDTGDKKFVDVDQLEDIKSTDTRNTIGSDVVCRVARNKRKVGLIVVCVLAYYLAIPMVVSTIFALFELLFVGFFCCLAISGALIFLAEFCRRKNKAISRIPSIDEVEIVKTYCVDKIFKNVNGVETLTYILGNGLEVTDARDRYQLLPNATCYIIYRKPENELKWIYSSINVKLDPTLKVTDTIA